MPPTEDHIREAAYHMWQAAGEPADRDEEFWFKALEELSKTPPKKAPAKRAAAKKPAAAAEPAAKKAPAKKPAAKKAPAKKAKAAE